ncbi:MAG: single-stranded DNA-binding protein [Candidatus Omnitrophota bacterium]
MAASLNKVFLMGNLTRDPELRYVPSGTAVANFTIAVNRPYKDSTGEKKEDVSFIRVVVWGKMAEICGEYLTKGRPVLVEGRLKSRTWEGSDGQKKAALDVVAVNVQFLGARGDKKTVAAPQQGMGDTGDEAGYGGMDSIDVDHMEEDTPF